MPDMVGAITEPCPSSNVAADVVGAVMEPCPSSNAAADVVGAVTNHALHPM